MTYRERRERRAERYRGWADKRQADAAATFAADEHYRGDHAFNFQPGHIPERARVIAREDRAHESLHKAARMDERADNIESQLAGAIYSDDPDAIEALEARIAELETERERIKTYNASARRGAPDPSQLTEGERANLASIARTSPYQLGKHGEFPAYHLSNLGGNIGRQRARLKDLKRRAAVRAKADEAPAEVCDFCKREVHAIGPREWVDAANNKASKWPEFHEHAPRGPWREGHYMKVSAAVHGLGLDPERVEVAEADSAAPLVSRLEKVAVIRDPSVPVGQPGPLHLNCPCGANPPTVYGGPDVECVCGVVYRCDGWRLDSEYMRARA